MHTAIQKAQQLITWKKYDLAEKNIKEHLAQFPEDARALALLAWCNCSQNKIDDAIKFAKMSLSKSPNDAPFPYLILADIHFQKRKLNDAEKYCDIGLSLFPYEHLFFLIKAKIEIEKNRFKKADKWATKGLSIAPHDTVLLNVKARILNLLKKNNEAAEMLLMALRIDPLDAEALCNKGWIALETKHYENSKNFFLDSLRQEPDNRSAITGFKLALLAKYKWCHPSLQLIVYLRKYGGMVGIGIVAGIASQAGNIFTIISEDFNLLLPIFFGLLGFILLLWLPFIPLEFAMLKLKKEKADSHFFPAEEFVWSQKK